MTKVAFDSLILEFIACDWVFSRVSWCFYRFTDKHHGNWPKGMGKEREQGSGGGGGGGGGEGGRGDLIYYVSFVYRYASAQKKMGKLTSVFK